MQSRWGIKWYHEGHALPNADQSSLLLPEAGAAQAGAYFVVISNALGTVTSEAAVLAVKTCQDVSASLIAWWPGDGSAADVAGEHAGTALAGAAYAPGKFAAGSSVERPKPVARRSVEKKGASTNCSRRPI